jgi:hypothetical protein
MVRKIMVKIVGKSMILTGTWQEMAEMAEMAKINSLRVNSPRRGDFIVSRPYG